MLAFPLRRGRPMRSAPLFLGNSSATGSNKTGAAGPGGQEVQKSRGCSPEPMGPVTPGSSEPPPKDFEARCLPEPRWSAAVLGRVPRQGRTCAVSRLPSSCSPLPTSPEPAADIVRNCSLRRFGNTQGRASTAINHALCPRSRRRCFRL